MAEETFEGFVARERERLNREREAIAIEQRELDGKLKAIDRELSAVDAYTAAKTGKPTAPPRQGRSGGGAKRGRPGTRREGILELIRQAADGIGRGEIIEKLRLKGHKSGEMSVSNALSALIKGNHVVRSGRKYRVG